MKKKCGTLQKKLDAVDEEKTQYKNMCKNVENYANTELTLLADIRSLSKDLMH